MLCLVRLKVICLSSMEVSEGETLDLCCFLRSVSDIRVGKHALTVQPHLMDPVGLPCSLSVISAAYRELSNIE
jgi:hypothetical protein